MKETLLAALFTGIIGYLSKKLIERKKLEQNKKENEPFLLKLGKDTHYTENMLVLDFENKGQSVKKVSFNPKGEFTIKLGPPERMELLDKNSKGKLIFTAKKQKLDLMLEFDMNYEYLFGEKGKKLYL